MSGCPANGFGCQCCSKLIEADKRESYWQNLYMLQQRYIASYKTMRPPSKQVFDGLAKYRTLLGLDGNILREEASDG